MNIDNISSINTIIIYRKFVHISILILFSFMLLAVKPFKIFPKHNVYGVISEIFALK